MDFIAEHFDSSVEVENAVKIEVGNFMNEEIKIMRERVNKVRREGD
jgi:hypothetical protein